MIIFNSYVKLPEGNTNVNVDVDVNVIVKSFPVNLPNQSSTKEARFPPYFVPHILSTVNHWLEDN